MIYQTSNYQMGVWTVFYFVYIMWWIGLLLFFTMLNDQDPYKWIANIKDNFLGGLLGIWMIGSVLIVNIAWPLLIVGPIWLVTIFGAPISAAVMAYAYGAFCTTLIFLQFKKRYGHILA